MQEKRTFHFLNQSFFDSNNDSRNAAISKQLNMFRKHRAWKNKAETAIQHFALSSSCYNHEGFLAQLCAFQDIIDLCLDDEDQMRQAEVVHSYFQERTKEEWFLLLYEYYFWHCNEGKKFLGELLAKAFFQEKIHVFSKSCEKFCNRKRDIPESSAQGRLEYLFGLLKMTQISCRNTKEAFTKYIMPSLKLSLSEAAFIYFQYCFQALKGEWNGNWYIFDVSLFAHDLLRHYEKEMKINFQQLTQDDQEIHADSIFVITLYYLIYGELTNWASIVEIPFVQNSKEIKNFQKVRKEKY